MNQRLMVKQSVKYSIDYPSHRKNLSLQRLLERR